MKAYPWNYKAFFPSSAEKIMKCYIRVVHCFQGLWFNTTMLDSPLGDISITFISERFCMVTEQVVTERTICPFEWSSWSSVFAGVVTAIALSIFMAVLGVALGFAIVDPQSDDPMAGLGVAFGIWSFLSVIVSMAGGGFVAGLASGRKGLEHGFLVWALSLVIATFFSSIAIGSAMKIIGSAVGTVGAGAAEAVGALGKGTADAASSVITNLQSDLHFSMDSDKLSDNIVSVLHDTGIKTLQPAYLKQQMREAGSDLRSSLRQISMEPRNTEQILSNFISKEEKRLDALTQGIDRNAAVNALMRTRNISRPEAEALVQDALAAYDQTIQTAKTTLTEAQGQLEDAQKYLKQLADEARAKADKIAAAAAEAALTAALALLIAALVAMYAGLYGVKYATPWYTWQEK